MYHFVYKSTNIITGEYYIGVHSSKTTNPDGYYGSGIKIKHQLKKYGKESFIREILHLCESRYDAFEQEKLIVTDTLLSDPMCLNLTRGGKGQAEEHTLSAREKIGRAASLRNKGKKYNRAPDDKRPGPPKGSPSPLKGRKNPHSDEHILNIKRSAIKSWNEGSRTSKRNEESLLTRDEKLKQRRDRYTSKARYTPEERTKIRRDAKLGTTQSEESKRKISESMKALHAKRKLAKALGVSANPTLK